MLLICNYVVCYTHFYSSSFLGAFFQNCKNWILSSWQLSVHMEQLSSHWTGLLEIWFLCIFQKFKFYQNLTRIMGTLPEDVCAFKWRLVELFLEWEMFQTKVVGAFSTYIARSVTFFEMIWENTVETGRLIVDNIVQCMCFACWII